MNNEIVSTHLLTVLTISDIMQSEQRNKGGNPGGIKNLEVPGNRPQVPMLKTIYHMFRVERRNDLCCILVFLTKTYLMT